jgi:hypothetical protein
MRLVRLLRLPLVLASVTALTFGAAGLVSAGAFTAGPLVQVSGSSPFAGCTADGVSGQPGTVVLHSEVEPWVAVNPTNPANIVGAWQQDRWSNGGSRGLVAGVSTDGGVTWSQVVIPKITLCSGGDATNGGDFKRATDPWLTFAPNGHLYQLSLSLDAEPPARAPGGDGKHAMLVSKSTDGGFSWSTPITLIREENPRFLNDKQSITADPTDSRFVYAVWDRLQSPSGAVINPENVIGRGYKAPVLFTRTTDGGATWQRVRTIYDPGSNNQTIGNQIVVLPDGTLVNLFNEILNFRNDDGGPRFEFNLSLIRSTDKGATWTRGRALRATKMQPRYLYVPGCCGVYDPETGDPVRTADLLPEVAVGPEGNLYAVWQDARFSANGSFANRDLLVDEVAFAMSTNGGTTWSAPIKINKTPTNVPLGNRQAFTPSVQAAADGTIGVTYYDFRNNTLDPGTLPTDYFVVHCHPSVGCTNPANWTDELRLTDASFDMRRAPLARGFFVGDYEGLAATGTSFAAFFSQSHGGDPASIFFRRLGP